jgi:3-oxoacid CoA-transferase
MVFTVWVSDCRIKVREARLISAPLVKTKQIKKMILSYVGTNKNLQDAYLSGEVALELSPQGTIAERLRSAASGMPGFFTRTGAGESISA